jgi:hypothetical protein
MLVTKGLKDLRSILVVFSNVQELFLALIGEEGLVLILSPIVPVVAGQAPLRLQLYPLLSLMRAVLAVDVR